MLHAPDVQHVAVNRYRRRVIGIEDVLKEGSRFTAFEDKQRLFTLEDTHSLYFVKTIRYNLHLFRVSAEEHIASSDEVLLVGGVWTKGSEHSEGNMRQTACGARHRG